MAINQITLSGQTLEERNIELEKEKEIKLEAENKEWDIKFYKSELLKLKTIKDVLIKGDGTFDIEGAEIKIVNGEPINISLDEKDEDGDSENWWERKKFLGQWWYCNSIKGWNNNTPQEGNSYKANEYDGVPDCELMSESIRCCFISVDRDNISWDKKYCLERLDKAIEGYEEKLENI